MLIVAAHRTGLVEATPEEPVEYGLRWGEDAQNQPVGEPTRLGNGERDQGVVGGQLRLQHSPFERRLWQSQANYHEVSERQHSERDVAISPVVVAHLVVIQPNFALASCQALLDRPAPAYHRDQRLCMCVHRGEGQI
jgi:hypothetical protein